MTSFQLARTPLHALHLRLGAKMVPFAGHDMPLHYRPGLLNGHLRAHLSEACLITVLPRALIALQGPGAEAALATLRPTSPPCAFRTPSR